MRCERCKASCEVHYAESYEVDWYCDAGVPEDEMNENKDGEWGCNLHWKTIQKRVENNEKAWLKDKENNMTREEIINGLYRGDGKAIKEAIKALEQEPCEDARSLAQVFEILGNLMSIPYDLDRPINKDDVSESMDAIRALEPVAPTRKIGKWIIDDEEHGRIWHCHCSNCKKDPQDYIGGTENWWLIRLPDYCPNCGSGNER